MDYRTDYRNKIIALNEWYERNQDSSNSAYLKREYFREYLERLNKIDTEFLLKIREAKKIPVYSKIYEG